MALKRALYYALWPLEQAFVGLAWLGRVSWALIIASNPALLAMWILRRDKRRQKEDQ